MRVSDVFGISNEVLPHSYVDRGKLDEELSHLVDSGRLHVALRGASKCGKSWLRRRVLQNPIVVQCLLRKSVVDLYTDALSQLDIAFISETTQTREVRGSVKATGEAGLKLLAKAGLEIEVEGMLSGETKRTPAGRDINDLRFIADILRASGRRLVIEDFHYLGLEERTRFAFDLKALWDWGVQIVVVGVWSVDNMILTLNPDLTGRVEEITISWSEDDLGRIIDYGAPHLNVSIRNPLRATLIEAAYGNAGQLQTLMTRALADQGIKQRLATLTELSSNDIGITAAMEYAEQLNPRYQTFARNVAQGIRRRTRSTNIYAHTMAVIMNASDDELINGFNVDHIYAQAKQREPRIQLGNLRSILSKIESLQIDEGGRGLVLSYNPDRGITVVDRQLLLYRKYSTVNWPWEDIIAASASVDSLQADEE